MKRIHLWISGHVQGVGFRWFCQERAAQLGITGYAKNLSDGKLEIEAQGDEESVDLFITAVSRGPRHASVTHVNRDERSVQLEETAFELQ
ncbi:MAG TPA: acylphosphatase [Candidatus Kapabacteria bacterium]|jgi:acylphosphatase|nr:acylphosphatase [Candidatus Kapabacteria bacterium]